MRKRHKESKYKDLEVNLNKEREGLHLAILDKAYNQIEAFFSYRQDLFIVRFDPKTPVELSEQYAGGKGTKLIDRFFTTLKRKINQQYKTDRVIYGWVREVEKAKEGHFHCWIGLPSKLVDHVNTNSETGFYGLMLDSWRSALKHEEAGIHVSGYHKIDRGDRPALSQCFYHLSYMAKSRGKQVDKDVKNHGGSRLRMNSKPRKISQKTDESWCMDQSIF